jgi:hypothetical protein
MPVVSRSAELLAVLAKTFGAADELDDPSYLDSVIFKSYDVAVVYNAARDVYSFSAGRTAATQDAQAPRRRAASPEPTERGAAKRPRRLRVMGATLQAGRLGAEIALADLTGPDLTDALDEFLALVADVRAGRTPRLKPAPEDESGPGVIWFRL